VGKGDGLLGRKSPGETIWLSGVPDRQQGRQNRNGPDGKNYAPESISWMHTVLVGQSMPTSGRKGVLFSVIVDSLLLSQQVARAKLRCQHAG
jgi:hypothetical protein